MRGTSGLLLCALVGCGGDSETTSQTTETTDTDTTETTETIDTALAVMGYKGDAMVDTDAGTYAGTETYYVTSIAKGTELCAFVYQVNANGGATWPPCADPEGNVCEFGFEVDFTDGAETAGDCGSFFGTLSTSWDGPAGYGYIEDYVWEGYSYGPSLMYYFQSYYTSTTTPSSTYYYGWGGVDVESDGGYVNWDPTSGAFTYDWVSDTISYFP